MDARVYGRELTNANSNNYWFIGRVMLLCRYIIFLTRAHAYGNMFNKKSRLVITLLEEKKKNNKIFQILSASRRMNRTVSYKRYPAARTKLSKRYNTHT